MNSMVLKEKGIPDSTMLKLVTKIVKKSQTAKGYRIKLPEGDVRVTAEEVVLFLEGLSNSVSGKSPEQIRYCETCGNFSRSGKIGKRGWCSPSKLSAFKNNTDYCSGWVPMSPEQKKIKEKIDEHHSGQKGDE